MTTIFALIAMLALAIAYYFVQKSETLKEENRQLSKDNDTFSDALDSSRNYIKTLLTNHKQDILELDADNGSLRQTIAYFTEENARLGDKNVLYSKALEGAALTIVALIRKVQSQSQSILALVNAGDAVAVSLVESLNLIDSLENELDEKDEWVRDAGIVIDAQNEQLAVERDSVNFLVDAAASHIAADGDYIAALESDNTYIRGQREELAGLVNRYDDAAEKFIAKVDSGRARSTETYKELKAVFERQPVETVDVQPVDSAIDNVNAVV